MKKSVALSLLFIALTSQAADVPSSHTSQDDESYVNLIENKPDCCDAFVAIGLFFAMGACQVAQNMHAKSKEQYDRYFSSEHMKKD